MGFGKMLAVLKREGCSWNHKRIRRVYCALGLNLRKKPKKRLPSRAMQKLTQPLKINYCWSIDFMSDALASGKRFRTFNVIDDFNREGLGILVGTSLTSGLAINYLTLIASCRGYPETIRCDNGPELISRNFLEWAQKHEVLLRYIEPGKPSQNAFIERFNRSYREEVLDINLFTTVDEAQEISDEWLATYNHYRPHESLHNLSPKEFVKQKAVYE